MTSKDDEEGSWLDHLFVAGLTQLHKDFCAQAAKEGWILCLPQPASIVSPERSVALTEDVLESHVLMRSPYFKRGYQSVHGKLVKLSDGSITTLTQPGLDGVGYSSRRTVKVLHDETVYNEDLSSFRVLHLQQPLEGESLLEESFEDLFDENRSFSSWLQQLRGLHTEAGVEELHEFCRKFNGSLSQRRVAQRDVAKEVQTACTHAAESLIFGGAFAAAAAGYRQYVLEVALQSYVHQHIYESVWRHVRREQRKKDDAFAQHLLALAASPTHTKGKIGVPHDLRGDLAPIVELLATLDTLESPLAKVECLDRVLNTVCAAAEGKSDDTVDTAFTDRAPPSRHTLARKRTGKHGHKAAEVRAVSSDDLLPLVMWTVVLASTPKPVAAWWANMQYLHTYLPDPGGRRGFCITTMTACLEYLRDMQPPPTPRPVTPPGTSSPRATRSALSSSSSGRPKGKARRRASMMPTPTTGKARSVAEAGIHVRWNLSQQHSPKRRAVPAAGARPAHETAGAGSGSSGSGQLPTLEDDDGSSPQTNPPSPSAFVGVRRRSNVVATLQEVRPRRTSPGTSKTADNVGSRGGSTDDAAATPSSCATPATPAPGDDGRDDVVTVPGVETGGPGQFSW